MIRDFNLLEFGSVWKKLLVTPGSTCASRSMVFKVVETSELLGTFNVSGA